MYYEGIVNDEGGADDANLGGTCGTDEVDLPALRSLRPGTLDLSGFDFDDLLARC